MTIQTKIDVAAARRALLEKMLSGDAGTGAAVAAPAPIPPRDPAHTVPLTAEQSQLWLHAQMAPDMPLYNESITIHRLGKYDHHALEMALSEIVRRHAIWRTAFHDVDGELQQAIADPMPITLALIDISDLPEDERDAEAVRLATEDARAPIPFDTAPLFRARVVKLGEEEHRLYLTLHHIIFDGVSIYRTLVPELAALVSAFEKGEPSPLPEPTLQYADYAAWQLDQADPSAIAKQVETWRTILAEPLPRLDLAGDRPRAALPTHAGSMEVFLLPDALIEQLKHLARAEGATLYMVLLAAYKAMLFRYTGDEDIIVGGVTDTRRRPELQPLMGYFLNTMALRSRPSGDRPFRQYLAEVKASVIGALGATDVPFDRLIRALDIKRGTGTHPLFNTLFSIEPPVEPFPDGWDLTQMDVTVGAAKYDLYLELDERPEGFAGRFLYSTELFDVATIRRMIGHWTRLLEGIAGDPATPLAALPMLDASERETLAATWNDTAQALPHGSVVDWFAAQVATQPDATALVHDDESWSYARLATASDTIAARLVAEGVTPGALVGLALGRSPWMVAAMLGVAKAGAAYLPLDPGFPPSRLALIAEDARPALVLVEPDTVDALPEGAAPLLTLARDWPDTPFAGPAIDPESLAYVLYTSGSTGKPKGVEIPHAALVNLLMGMQQAPGFARGETLLAVTTLSFDIAELELWLPLVSGGTVAIASREAASDMAELIALIERVQPHVLQATPATWRGLIESGWRGAPSLRVLCGGEKLPRALADQLLPRVGEVWNMYGPTETTIWSTVARVEPGTGAIPIGHPIANTVVRVLDSAGNDLPIGAVGELLIGGRGLATGYRGRPDLTDERFVEHRGERLYRTGDLGRWRADGVLECLGRTDNEEKIRGFRVAIEEVEGALAKLPGVSGAAVKAWPDASGERALAGYIVGPGDAHVWRELLSAALPDYMIPTKFVAMDALPLTPNGKVDRNALPEPGVSTSRNTEPPATPEEVRLAAIWCAVLQVEQVARYDDFFDLGGHSLLIARLLRRVQAEYNIRLPMAALFRAPRLADMAELIATGRAAEKASPIVPIQPHGTQRPLLWLDGGSTFLPLSERLGNDQPFLGISVDAILEQTGGCPKKLEDAAVLVAATLREAQPVGPYRIGGWCTSGILAYAVAQEMRAAGDEVELLMLVHAFHPGKARTIGEVRFFLSKFQFHIGQSMAQPRGERLRYFRQRLRGLSDAAALRGGREAVLQPKLRTQLDRAAMKYSTPPYEGEMILFQPSDHPGVLDFVEDWRAVAQGGFAAHVVSGGHRTMLEPPNVDHFADLLRDALDATLVDEAPRRAVG
ncbi:amino acid adenylation domain-containing protein [Sphingomonas sp. RT2P30]|uniref:non-ribosomal peptide synthetase n=1 Tax=Parasphingomonas halimpatiens TaxID=3096162 RepID=UPI002FCB7B8B